DLTPSLNQYIENKLGGLSRFIKKFEEKGVAELWLEVARTTEHHYKGEVFMAEADLRLPGKVLRAVGTHTDIRTALDKVRDTLRLEIEKYKTRTEPRRRAR
ncbi:MAG: ribosome-associated translation inhibitor RaiA, partial [Patescibacteria group bacterium]